MDFYFFLKQRTDLIRHFYEAAAAPFIETKRLIEAAEYPFSEPPYDESGEPPYVEEWLRADTEIQLIGRAAVSMLSEALKQFLVSWERRRWKEPPCQNCFKAEFKSGFVAGYLACFSKAAKVDLHAECPADMAIVEQVVLARNRSQHADQQWPHVEHDDKTRSKYPNPYFMRDDDFGRDHSGHWFIGPALQIDAEKLHLAIGEVEVFAEWMQRRLEALLWPRRSARYLEG